MGSVTSQLIQEIDTIIACSSHSKTVYLRLRVYCLTYMHDLLDCLWHGTLCAHVHSSMLVHLTVSTLYTRTQICVLMHSYAYGKYIHVFLPHTHTLTIPSPPSHTHSPFPLSSSHPGSVATTPVAVESGPYLRTGAPVFLRGTVCQESEGASCFKYTLAEFV